jgi:hypothetical protein
MLHHYNACAWLLCCWHGTSVQLPPAAICKQRRGCLADDACRSTHGSTAEHGISVLYHCVCCPLSPTHVMVIHHCVVLRRCGAARRHWRS